ncbi:MAG TPA: DnaA regulatory inactivator Hda [Burkholderiales bacterium]|nr:DnaA regulatory inactivator Hda [Burkholderiales bacterium]
MKQLAFDLVPPPAPTLDNFVIGSNAELVQRLRTLGASAGAERAIYIWGPPGSGRTHLLRGAVADLDARGLRTAYCGGSAGLATAAPDTIQAAAVDDVETLDESGAAALFRLYNAIRERGGVFLAAGTAPPARLRLRADVVTRLGWGLVFELHPLTDSDKEQALSEHAAARGFSLTPEVARYLLARSQRDMGNLIATVDALDRYSMETKRAVTVPLLRELLES